MSDSLWDLVDGNWGSIRALAGTARDLFALDRDTNVYRVDPRTGAVGESLGDGFDGDSLVMVGDTPHVLNGPATVLGGRIFNVEDRALYSIDPATGDYEQLENSWDTRFLIGHGDHLYAWEADNNLYRVDPRTGGAEPLANNTWPHVAGVASAIGRLYAVDDDILYQVDPRTGGCTEISDRLRTRLLVGAGSSIYSLAHSGELFRIGVG